MKVNCIFCGKETAKLRPIISGRQQIGTVRICSGCGRQFPLYVYDKPEQKKKQQPKKPAPRPKKEPQQPVKELPQREDKKIYCTIRSCATRKDCDTRGDAMRCPVYRAVRVRKLRVLE